MRIYPSIRLDGPMIRDHKHFHSIVEKMVDGMTSLTDLRAQLTALETERTRWTTQRTLHQECVAWIERQQTQEKCMDVDNSRREKEEMRTKPSTREEIQELQKKTLQILKTQQQVASQITSQLRTMQTSPHNRDDPQPSSSPPQSTTHGNRRKNKLILVPTTTTALGKRQFTQKTPTVSYPPFTHSTDVPIDSLEDLAAVAFRVASRSFLHIGQTMTRAALRTSIETYVGRSLREDEIVGIIEELGSAMQVVMRDAVSDEAESSGASSSATRLAATSVNAETIVTWLETEKSVLDELLTAWSSMASSIPRSMRLVATVRAHQFAHAINGPTSRVSMTTMSTLLSALVGNTPASVVETAFPHLTKFFAEAQVWLSASSGCAKDVSPVRVLADDTTLIARKFDRPFDVENDSVMKQVHTTRKRRRRGDPMKVLCVYELSGTCNDPSCAYQHQRDFEADGESKQQQETQDSDTHNLQLTDTTTSCINQFVQLRENVRSRWPAFDDLLNSKPPEKPLPSMGQVSQGEVEEKEEHVADSTSSNAWDEDFVELGSPLSSPIEDDPFTRGRYCNDNTNDGGASISASGLGLAALEKRVKENPEDLEAWFLLAMRSLELEIAWSDENVVRVPDSARLLAELEALHSLLQTNLPSTTNDYKIVLSLHTLSRALEVEANAYCEELWFLHLRLSQLLTTNRDVEVELQMTEQALSFVRTSVPLWRHFLTLQASCLDKLDDGVTTYCALLEAIVAAAKPVKRQQIRDAFSVLLCDVVIQLCAIYCDAGNAPAASTFLWSLLEGRSKSSTDEDDTDSGLRHALRDQMLGDEILVLYILHVHVALFSTVPLWLRERGFDCAETVNVYRFLLPPASVQSTSQGVRAAVEICEAAFKTYGDASVVPPGIEVLRHNWIVVTASSDHVSFHDRVAQLTTFVDEELQRETLLPRVVTVLASLFRDVFQRRDMYTKLMEELMARYKTIDSTLPVAHVYQRFGEALHHYLLHHRDFLSRDPFTTEFPTLKFFLTRLTAILPGKRPVYSKRALKAIAADPDWRSQRTALAELLTALIRDTLDHIVKSHLVDADHDDTDEQDLTQDTYYVVAQLQLLSQVCGMATAIDVADHIVLQGSASHWRLLPVECRRIVWSVRFMLLLDHLQEDTELYRSRELQQLFDRYLTDLGPRSNTNRDLHHQLSSRLQATGEKSAIVSAIGFCVESPGARPTSALDLALFHLCLAATPSHDRPGLCTSYQYRLESYAEFWHTSADTALQESDWRRVRSGLRRLVTSDTRVLDTHTLRLLVALELNDKNVEAVSHALGHRLRVNPLDNAAWELVTVLETLFGEQTAERISAIATKLANTGGVQLHLRSILGHTARVQPPTTSSAEAHVKFPGLRLEYLPPPLIMHFSNALRVLDLSNNLLISVPPAICHLAQLQELILSGNALVALPPEIGLLVELRVIDLSHNNLSDIPNAFWDRLVELREVDIRSNALSGISPRIVHLTNLQVLRVAGNRVQWTAFEPLSTKLPVDCRVDIAPMSQKAADEDDRSDELMCVDTESSLQPKEGPKAHPPEATTDAVMASVQTENDGDVVSSHESPVDSVLTEPRRPSPPSQSENMMIGLEDKSKSRRKEPTIVDSEETSVADAEMTGDETEHPSASTSTVASDRAPSASPRGDVEVSDDDDDVECLGSSLLPAAPLAASSTNSSVSNTQTSNMTDEVRRSLMEVVITTEYPRCTVCSATNTTGTHQRFNFTVLCINCIAAAIQILREQRPTAS